MSQSYYFIAYAATGKAPTIAEFMAMLPKMEWSYKEEA